MASNPQPEDPKLDVFENTSVLTRRRKRTVFTQEQFNILINSFQKNPFPGIQEREQLAANIGVDESRIQVWFQNRRARQLVQQKKQPSVTFSNSNSSPSQEELEESDLSGFDLSPANASRLDSWSGPEGSMQGASSVSSWSMLKKNRIPSATPEAAYLQYGTPESHQVGVLLCSIFTPVPQGSFSHSESSWVLQGTQGPGRMKPLLQQQQQQQQQHDWQYSHCPQLESKTQLYQSHPSQPRAPQMGQPSIFQPLPSISITEYQSPQEHQSQIQSHPLVVEDQTSLSSFNQQKLQPICTSDITAGLESPLLFPNQVKAFLQQGYLDASREVLAAHQEDLDRFLGDFSEPVYQDPC